jgi:hypothetical protein
LTAYFPPCFGSLALLHPLPLSWPHFPQVRGNALLLCWAQYWLSHHTAVILYWENWPHTPPPPILTESRHSFAQSCNHCWAKQPNMQ